jgi:cyclase
LLKRRLIPVLFLQDGWMVRSQDFLVHQAIGDPVHHVRRLMQWDVDELIVVDIGHKEMQFGHDRSDYRNKPVTTLQQFIALIAVECRIPLTFGGRIRTVADVRERIRNGADKVTVNTALADAPDEVTRMARTFGSQAVVASIDYRIVEGAPQVFVGHGRRSTGYSATEWASRAIDCGAGEILLNSIDRDGNARGYDIDTINAVADVVRAPVIACGGAGNPFHFLKCFNESRASAVAAGNIFHFTENAYPNAKILLRKQLPDIR